MHIMHYIAIGLAILIVLILVASYFSLKKQSAICPRCRHVWKPKFLEALFGLHMINEIGLTCPNCDSFGMQRLVKDKKLNKQQFSAVNCRKIAVVGCAGSGKSYFSNELSDILSLPCYHMDNLFWKPNWVETPIEEFGKIVENLVNLDEWIIDGNYARTMEMRVAKADIVFFLDMPTEVCLEGEKARRGTKRSDFPDFLEEREDLEFLEWIRNFRENDRRKIIDLISKYPQVEVVTFSARDEVDKYLNNLRGAQNK